MFRVSIDSSTFTHLLPFGAASKSDVHSRAGGGGGEWRVASVRLRGRIGHVIEWEGELRDNELARQSGSEVTWCDVAMAAHFGATSGPEGSEGEGVSGWMVLSS